MSDDLRRASSHSRRRSAAESSASFADGRGHMRNSRSDSTDSVRSSSGDDEMAATSSSSSHGDILGPPTSIQNPQQRGPGEVSLKISSSFSGSHRSAHSTASTISTVRSLDSTLADGHAHVHPSSLGRYVRLNVGGSLFYTTIDTLCKKDTMLRAMFTGDMAVQVDRKG